MLNAMIGTISTRKQQRRDCTSKTKTERKISMDGAGPDLRHILISLTKRPGLGGPINLVIIVTTDRHPRSILGTT